MCSWLLSGTLENPILRLQSCKNGYIDLHIYRQSHLSSSENPINGKKHLSKAQERLKASNSSFSLTTQYKNKDHHRRPPPLSRLWTATVTIRTATEFKTIPKSPTSERRLQRHVTRRVAASHTWPIFTSADLDTRAPLAQVAMQQRQSPANI